MQPGVRILPPPSQSEVDEFEPGMVARHEKIARLDVAMNHAMCVYVRNSIQLREKGRSVAAMLKPSMTDHLATQDNQVSHGKSFWSPEHTGDLVPKDLHGEILVILRPTPGIRDRNVRVSFKQN